MFVTFIHGLLEKIFGTLPNLLSTAPRPIARGIPSFCSAQRL
jgi:hypothetical protein